MLISNENEKLKFSKEDETIQFTKEKNPEIFNISDNYNKNYENGEEGYINYLYNFIIRKSDEDKNYNYLDCNFNNIQIQKKGNTKESLIKQSNTTLSTGPLTGTDNTDDFLELLYKNNGKYESIYGGKVKVGDLLVNGDEMLFQLLDSSYTEEKICNTYGLSNVMRLILQKYTGRDYGVSGLDYSIFNMKEMEYNGMSVVGENAEEQVWCSLKNMGFSEYAIAGVMGNIYRESGFNADAIEKGSGAGFGLCQWTGGRRTQLENYAAAKGVSASDIYTQIEFLMAELTPGGGANGYANYQLMTTSYSGTRYTPSDWKEAKSIEDATRAFCFTYERPNVEKAGLDVRIEKAKEYYEKYKGKSIEEISNVNSIQLKIAEIAQNSSKYNIQAKSGYCLAWVNDVYQKAGAKVERKDCAFCSGYNFGVSKDFSNIPIGAAVYGEGTGSEGYLYGHVGIYVGNGLVADNIGRVRITTLSKWRETFPNGCWGWTSSTPVNNKYKTIKGLIHAGRH